MPVLDILTPVGVSLGTILFSLFASFASRGKRGLKMLGANVDEYSGLFALGQHTP